MKLLLIILTMLFVSITKLNAQILEEDIELQTNGISVEYENKFQENIDIFLAVLSDFGVTDAIKPIIIEISYEDRQGYIAIRAKYKHEDIFARGTEYYNHNLSSKYFGDGISVGLIDHIFTALTRYKRTVATDGLDFNQDISDLTNIIRLTNNEGNWVNFYSYNYAQSGYYRFNYYNHVLLNHNNERYTIETVNFRALSEFKYFVIGAASGLDGKKSGNYYLRRFFQLDDE
ncbi:hypothetical protein [Rhodohalobacter sp. 614A]|uniref:hypothetical protein n=1 Tax=Rhodohalobacter sp. 614A TaxID=2908649 RepID=UPI001F4012F4|nr:hypothetical protein [Rhodohalobacter sp. 614A]